jgi:thioredoxin-dependent peroxiredoxin
MVKKGDPAPDFELEADDGSTVRLKELRGEKVVLYFYPKDDTSGCTTQACEFRDSFPRFDEKGARILGVSPDSAESHRKFKEKYDLNFPLLVDDDHSVSEAYGVWKEKSMYGRKYWGIERSTFLIDEEGRIEQAWRKVRPKGHAEVVAEVL